MLNFIDNFLNRITMYRLMLYFLMSLVLLSLILSALGILSFEPLDLALSAVILIIATLVVNKIFAWVFKAPVNAESSYITALILALIIYPPVVGAGYLASIGLLSLTAAIAMAAKYLLAFRHKHIFNPAAVAVSVAALTGFGYSASWWAGNINLLPLIVLGGFLIVRKIQRWEMVGVFFGVVIITVLLATINGTEPAQVLKSLVLFSPIFFFAFVMLTEPLTAPLGKWQRLGYAGIIGFLFAWPTYIGNFYILPEMALLIGNFYAFTVSPKGRYLLTLVRKNEIGTGMQEFVFTSDYPVKYEAGQYLEWTLSQHRPDLRGNRRFFTLASSPTEKEIILATKFYENPSTFKSRLNALQPGEVLSASHQSGDFTLPADKNQKLAFIAGGIGIAPFRSMVKSMLDKNESRDAVLFYSCKTQTEVAYHDLFGQAASVGVKTVYALTDQSGPLTAEKIQAEAPDFKDRMFYLAGPRGMVVAFEKTLKDLAVPQSQIKIDFFPGYV